MTILTPAQVQEMEDWITDPHRCNISEQVIIRFARLIASHRAVEQERHTFRQAAYQWKDKWEQSQAEATRLRTALEKAPWISSSEGLDIHCCWCGGYRDDGHKATCFIQQALTGQEARMNEEELIKACDDVADRLILGAKEKEVILSFARRVLAVWVRRAKRELDRLLDIPQASSDDQMYHLRDWCEAEAERLTENELPPRKTVTIEGNMMNDVEMKQVCLELASSIAARANRCCERSDGYEEELRDTITTQLLEFSARMKRDGKASIGSTEAYAAGYSKGVRSVSVCRGCQGILLSCPDCKRIREFAAKKQGEE